MHTIKALVAGCLLAACISACTIQVPVGDSLLSVGTPFVLSGTAEVADNGGPCLVWRGDNGITYHLFQDRAVDNEIFDRVTTPGVRSRLELSRRTDLEVACEIGTIVEVIDVLEIVN